MGERGGSRRIDPPSFWLRIVGNFWKAAVRRRGSVLVCSCGTSSGTSRRQGWTRMLGKSRQGNGGWRQDRSRLAGSTTRNDGRRRNMSGRQDRSRTVRKRQMGGTAS